MNNNITAWDSYPMGNNNYNTFLINMRKITKKKNSNVINNNKPPQIPQILKPALIQILNNNNPLDSIKINDNNIINTEIDNDIDPLNSIKKLINKK